ncbi:Uncharacterised protein at_DN0492 [Pycnogonum litorale]
MLLSPHKPIKSMDMPLSLDVTKLETGYNSEICVINRKKTSFIIYLLLCSIFLVFETSKQVFTYSTRYYNGGIYPMSQTALVAIVELMKLSCVVFLYLFKNGFRLQQITPPSVKFVIPSLLYTINNNLYYYALNIVPPPIWMVIIQIRVVLTALVYRFGFRREMTTLQWMGTIFITVAVVTNEIPNIIGEDHIVIPLAAIVLSLASAIISCGASVYTELLLKNSPYTFLGQQIQLYFFGTVIAMTTHLVSSNGENPFTCSGCKDKLLIFVVLCLLVNSAAGMAIAAVIKLLDNIVKIYTSAIANIMTAILCTWLFPDTFEFDLLFILSLLTLFIGIYFYEMKILPEQVHGYKKNLYKILNRKS